MGKNSNWEEVYIAANIPTAVDKPAVDRFQPEPQFKSNVLWRSNLPLNVNHTRFNVNRGYFHVPRSKACIYSIKVAIADPETGCKAIHKSP